MNYDEEFLKINKQIITVKTKIKKANEKANNAIITRNIQLWDEAIKEESYIMKDISDIKQVVDKLQIIVKKIGNPYKVNINNILCSYINLMKQENIIIVGQLSLSWRIIKIYDKNTTILEIIILLKEIIFIISQIIKPLLIIITEKKAPLLIEQKRLLSSTLININNDVYKLVNIIETKNLNNINNITLEKLDIIEQLVKIKEEKDNYIPFFTIILKKNLLIINNTKLLINNIVFFTQKMVQNIKNQYIKIGQTFLNRNNIWISKLEWVKKYMNENKKRPSTTDKNKDVKTYGMWISHQVTNYKKNDQIMTENTIRKLWEDFINDDKYKIYFLTNEEEWNLNLEWVKKYIDENKKRQSERDKNKDVKMCGKWIGSQIQNYKKKQYIMANDTIRKLWEDFINDDKYKNYFIMD